VSGKVGDVAESGGVSFPMRVFFGEMVVDTAGAIF